MYSPESIVCSKSAPQRTHFKTLHSLTTFLLLFISRWCTRANQHSTVGQQMFRNKSQLKKKCRFHCHSHCQALIIGATLATFDQPVYYANAPRDPSPIRSELTRWLTTVRRSSASGPGANIAAATAKYQSVSWSNTTSRLGLRTPTCTLDWFWIYN